MSYQALYRKFRPATFEDVKGQEHIVTTLKNQVRADRIGHAYLFCGTRGTGKTTIAKILARTVNCADPQDGNPCGVCAMCRSIAAGTSMNVIEIDAASNNGVDNIREIVEEVSFSPAEGKYKVYIIDEVHMLSNGAFNALLKTLEEPPSYVIFILATTEAHKIPITILSRCQRYDFRRISIDTIADRLRELMAAEQVDVEEKALRYVAKAGDGSMRDALSLLDQCIAFHFGEALTYDMVLDVLGAVDNEVFGRLLRLLVDQDIIGAITLLEEVIAQGRELAQFITDFIWYLRNLLLLKTSDGIEDVVEASAENMAVMQEEAGLISDTALMRYIRIFSELQGQLRYATAKRVMIEMTLIKICRPAMEVRTDALLERIRDLERRLESGEFAAPVSQKASAQGDSVQTETPAQPPKKIELPAAVPEDIREIVGRWGEILEGLGQPVKTYLAGARLSLGADAALLIVMEDGLAYDYFTQHQEHKEGLRSHISEVCGRQVEIEIRALERTQQFENHYADLSSIIHMEIEEE